MKNHTSILIAALLLIGLTACSPKLNYVGSNTYDPTTNVDVYFDSEDVPRPYAVIGYLNNQADSYQNDNPDKVKEVFIKKAKKLGADAILYDGFYSEKDNTEVGVSSKGSKSKTSLETNNKKKQFQVKLLKYK